MPVGLYQASLDGRIMGANPALAHLLGYSRAEDLQHVKTIDTYVNPADRERLLAMVREHGTARMELLLQRRDGSIFSAEIWTRLVTDDGEPEADRGGPRACRAARLPDPRAGGRC